MISVAEQLTNRCLLSTGFALVYVERFIKVLRFSMSTFPLFPFRLLVFDAFLCRHRQVDRFKVSCFSMSSGFALVYVDRFKVLRFSMSIFALFPVNTCRQVYAIME